MYRDGGLIECCSEKETHSIAKTEQEHLWFVFYVNLAASKASAKQISYRYSRADGVAENFCRTDIMHANFVNYDNVNVLFAAFA